MRLAILDLAGTTMVDDGLVLDAVRTGLRAARVCVDGPRYPALDRQARATMDRSTITVFGELLDGDMYRARRANDAFEQSVREAGLSVALICGFGPALRDRLVEALDWGAQVDVVLSPADVAGLGLPDPAVVHAAARICDVPAEQVTVAGDSTADIEGAVRAGAALAVGVRPG